MCCLTMIEPFNDYLFMQRALLGSLIFSISAVPVGTFMIFRRMSLTGDAMAHAILPGVSLAYFISGGALIGMTVGGICAGLLVVILSGWTSRNTLIKEDTSLTAFYLISLALGVSVISLTGNNINLSHILFGNILALNNVALLLITIICSISLLLLTFLYRPLVIQCVDPMFLFHAGFKSYIPHYGLLGLMIINLVAGFHALGTLLAIGIMILPAASARFWAKRLYWQLIVSIIFSFSSCYIGLLISYYFDLPSGATIILSIGALYIASLLIGLDGGYIIKNLNSMGKVEN